MFSKANQFARRVAASRRNSGTRHITMEQLEDRRVLSASLQVIHNSPYDAASVVDVYVDDALALDNLEFRDATGFIDLPSDTPLKIDIKGPESTDSSPAVFSADFRTGLATNIF